jgi:hypothetical protein
MESPETNHSSTAPETSEWIDYIPYLNITHINMVGNQIDIQGTQGGESHTFNHPPPQTVQRGSIFAQAAGLTLAIVDGVQVCPLLLSSLRFLPTKSSPAFLRQ